MNVLITGAAGGLGRAFAIECASRGYSMLLTDVNQAGLLSIQSGLRRQFHAEVEIEACDLTSAESVDAMLEKIDRQGMRFDMLLNIAGLDYEGGFAERAREDIAKIVMVNDVGTLRITHAILDRRNPDGPFTTVFVSSLASMFPMPLKATYAASKRFLLDFATALRLELRDQNVRVLALCPGGLATTEGAMQGIAAQGFGGDATTNRLEEITKKTLDRALKGKALYVPGTVNGILSFLGKIAPRNLVAELVYSRWHTAQQKWLDLKPKKLEADRA